MSIVKVLAFFVSIVLYIIIASYMYGSNILIQSCILTSVLVALAIRTSIQDIIAEMKLIMWFAFLFLIIWALFILLRIDEFIFKLVPFVKSTSNISQGFLTRFIPGLSIIMNFINTMFFIKFAFSFISIEDFLKLPWDIKYMKVLLLGKMLFVKGIHAIKNIEFHVNQFPNLKKSSKDSFVKKNQKKFKRNLIILLTLIFYILQEAEIRGELIDNRINHCFKVR